MQEVATAAAMSQKLSFGIVPTAAAEFVPAAKGGPSQPTDVVGEAAASQVGVPMPCCMCNPTFNDVALRHDTC